MLVADALRAPPAASARARRLAADASCVALALLCCAPLPFALVYAVTPPFYAWLVYAISRAPDCAAARLLNRDVLNRVGDYSLGIYVLHAAVIWWVHLCVAGGIGASWAALASFDFSPAGPLGRNRDNCWGKGAGCALIGAKFRAHFDGVPFAWDVGPVEYIGVTCAVVAVAAAAQAVLGGRRAKGALQALSQRIGGVAPPKAKLA